MKRTVHLTLKDRVTGELEQYQITLDALDPGTEVRSDGLLAQIVELIDGLGKHVQISGFTVSHHWTSKLKPGLLEHGPTTPTTEAA
jgi:hypothetical protein